MSGTPPVVIVTGPIGAVVPGSNIQFTWTATDPDTKVITGAWSGHDQENNVVSGTVTIQVQDDFVMDTFTLGSVSLLIDNVNRKATGVVPLS